MPRRGQELAAWLRDRVHAARAQGLVVGLSGGIDSAVVVRLCQLAAPDHVAGLIMPAGSDPRDEQDARLVAEHFGVRVARVDLAPAHAALLEAARSGLASLGGGERERAAADRPDDLRSRVPEANLKPRLRMATLYYVANSLNYLVAGTGNRSELAIGYFTKYGDGGVDVLPIGHLLKSEVRALAAELDVPRAIIDRPPSAGLWQGQTDEGEMGFTYADLEAYLTRGASAVDPALAARLDSMIRASEHKRSTAPLPG